MKENYAKQIMESDRLPHILFELMWGERETGDVPEKEHPNWKNVEKAYDDICEGKSDDAYRDLWDIVECFAETYYIMGLKQGLSTLPLLLPTTNKLRNPFKESDNVE